MPFILTQSPEIEINNDGETSHTIAAHNYIRYKFKRQDRVFFSVYNQNGKAVFRTSGLYIVGEPVFVANKTYYFDGGAYKTNGTILSIHNTTTTPPGGLMGAFYTDYVTDIDFAGNFSGSITATFWLNWRLEAEIFHLNPNPTLIAKSAYKALPNGNITVDIQEFVKPLLNNVALQPNPPQFTSTGKTAIVYVSLKEVFFDPDENQDVTGQTYQTEPIVACNAVMQLGEPNAPNLIDYTLQRNPTTLAKWATAFKEPSHWLNLPFYTHILSNDTTYPATFLVHSLLDGNQNLLYTLAVQKQIFKGALQRYWPINQGIFSNAEYEELALYITDPSGQSPSGFIQASEKLLIRLKKYCPKNALHLVWINQFGGTDSYLFSPRYSAELDIKNSNFFEPYIDDMETATARAIPLTKTANQTLTVGVQSVDQNDIDGLRSLLLSPAIYLVNPTNPAQSQRVTIENGSFVVQNTAQNLYNLELKLNLPEVFTM